MPQRIPTLVVVCRQLDELGMVHGETPRLLTLRQIARRMAGHRPASDSAAGRAAVALILRPAPCARGGEALFILRAEHPDDPWSGHMGLPGGRSDPADRSLLHTACRETAEEVGIDLDRSGRLLGQLDDVRAVARGRAVDLAITPYVFELVDSDVTVRRDVREVQEVHWIDLGSLLAPDVATTVPYAFEGRTLQLPACRVNDRVIWGLTYQMLQTFFAVVVPRT